MKREPRITKRDRKAAAPPRPAPPPRAAPKSEPRTEPQHIHCVACGRHLDPVHFQKPQTAVVLKCLHDSAFAACTKCVTKAQAMLDEHDQTNTPVQPAKAWH